MNKHCRYLLVLISLSPNILWCQTDSLAPIEMEEFIKKSGLIKNYNDAKNEYKIADAYAQIWQMQSLTDQLNMLFPIYMRSYGNAMNTGISMRGTNSEHTAVNWNGININNPSLGIASFSSLYLNMVDDIYIQPGGNSATGGSGAIGGSINLEDHISLVKKPINLANINLSAGSFHSYFFQSDALLLRQNFSNSFKVLYGQSKNDFTYRNAFTTDNSIQKNTGSEYNALNLKWNTAIRLNDKTHVKCFTWYELNNKNLQQGIGTVNNHQQQRDRNIKSVATINHQAGKKLVLSGKAAYLIDELHYSSLYTNNLNQIQRLIAEVSAIYTPNNHWHLKSGISNQYYILSANTNQPERRLENRTELYLFNRYILNKHWVMNFNLRQVLVDGNMKPICLDIAAKRTWLMSKYLQIWSSVSGSRNYRLPTLNERFWTPGGNSAILPELSYNGEASVHISRTKKNWSEALGITYYTSKISNWIQWQPGYSGFWEARNVGKIVIQGIELNSQTTMHMKKTNLMLNASYTYNSSANIDLKTQIKRQLIYIPYNIINLGILIQRQSWVFTTNWLYTGFRFTTTDNMNWLPAYHLLNASAQKSIPLKNHKLNLALLLTNMLNTRFQTIENFAMPGRAVILKLQLKINNI